jgi:hypothetical protein
MRKVITRAKQPQRGDKRHKGEEFSIVRAKHQSNAPCGGFNASSCPNHLCFHIWTGSAGFAPERGRRGQAPSRHTLTCCESSTMTAMIPEPL